MMSQVTGYLALAEIASLLDGTEIFGSDQEPTQSDIASFCNANAELLRDARNILKGECKGEFEFTQAYLQMRMDTSPDLRRLAQSFALELKQSVERADFEQVVNISCDLLALGNVIREGAFVFDEYLASGCDSTVVVNVRQIRWRFPISEAQRLAYAVMQFDLARKPYDEILVRDREWDAICGTNDEGNDSSESDWAEDDSESDPEIDQLVAEWNDYYSGLPQEDQDKSHQDAHNRSLALLRLLAIELALNAFHKVHGSYPKEVCELGPELIPAIPLDPFTGKQFVYRPNTRGYCLYSPGPSGRDQGGRPGNWLETRAGQADLFLDMYDYECDHISPPRKTSILSGVANFFRALIGVR